MYRALKIGGLLIAAYIIAAKATDLGKLLGSAGTSGVGVVKAFQGR